MMRVVRGSVTPQSVLVKDDRGVVWRCAFVDVGDQAVSDEWNTYVFARWLGINFVPEVKVLDVDTIREYKLPVPPRDKEGYVLFEKGTLSDRYFLVRWYDTLAVGEETGLSVEQKVAVRLFDLATLNSTRSPREVGQTPGDDLILLSSASAFSIPFVFKASDVRKRFKESGLTTEELNLPRIRDMVLSLIYKNIDDVLDQFEFRYGRLNEDNSKATWDVGVPPKDIIESYIKAGKSLKEIRRLGAFKLPVEIGRGLPGINAVTEAEYLRQWIKTLGPILEGAL